MNLMGPLAALLGIEIETITDRVRNAVIINALLVVFGLAGVGFLIAALYLWIASELGGIYAALILSASFLVLALAVYLGGQISEGRRKRVVATKRRSNETSAFVTTAALTALPVLLKSPVVRTLGIPAAAIAAFLLFRGGHDRTDD